MSVDNLPKPKELNYLPDDFKVTTWSKLKPYFSELENRAIDSVADLEKWILDRSEVDAVVGEDFRWRYIRLSQNSEDQQANELFQYAVQELTPKVSVAENELNKKLVNSPFLKDLNPDKYYIYARGVENEVKLFREENIELHTKEQLKSKEFGAILSQMLIEVDGKEMTLQQAGQYLEETDRELRKTVYLKIQERLSQDSEKLNSLFDELRAIRHQMALNAGFDNYRDYKFQEMGRFDYEVKDCENFHDSISEVVLPVMESMLEFRKEALGVDQLKPWDLAVDTSGKAPLRPFENTRGLIDKSIEVLTGVHPYFGRGLEIMDKMDRLDLDSRKGKHPGGYNMSLLYSGVPFIFMNAANSMVDLHTLMHESGHAVHALLTHSYDLTSAKNVPSEVAELASMSMELLSMDHWDVFFDNADDLRRAKIYQLQGVLKTLPWVATIDKFQHWLYVNHSHTREEREAAWLQIYNEFSPAIVDKSGLEKYSKHLWHRQLHIFEVPFYYIEYGMAQLGAIAIWKRYRENPTEALEDYIQALKLGYTKKIGEIYAAAGIEFNFSSEYVNELAQFVQEELDKVLN
ncbi:MAG: M3 family oligoendopeptidase [Saprospiraceae bacterium]